MKFYIKGVLSTESKLRIALKEAEGANDVKHNF